VGWRAYPPPCGQLTRCFSAVAELLVNTGVYSLELIQWPDYVYPNQCKSSYGTPMCLTP